MLGSLGVSASGAETTASETAAAASGAGTLGETIYVQQRRVARDGTETLSAEGSPVVTLDDGSLHTVDLDLLTDPDGRTYALFGSVVQEAEDADVLFELRLVEEHPLALSEDQLSSAWLDANPTAGADDLAAFQARRAAGPTMPEAVTEVDELVEEWLEAAEDGEMEVFTIKLTEQPALDLPWVGLDLADTDPVFLLDQLEDRLIAVEARKTEVEDLQADLQAVLLERGASIVGKLWSVNALLVEANASTVAVVARDPAVSRVEFYAGDVAEATNRGEEIRQASQITQYLDNDFDGSISSGRSTVDTIFVALLDDKLDIDHPAWLDCGFVTCQSRLLRQEEWSGSAWEEDTVGISDTGAPQHGMYVAGQLLGDLTDGQDPSIPGSPERRARTGMTTETSFVAIDKGFTGGIDLGLDRGIELNADIMNLSAGCSGCSACDLTHTRNDQVNVAFHAGVFFTKGAGNEGHDPARVCRVVPPSLAAGAFVVGGYSPTAANLNSASIASFSSRGGDAADRPVVNLTAAAGRSATGLPEYDDSYTTETHYGTSLAAPIAAGAAANLKHQLIDRWGPALANQVGFLHAMMLLMGDGQLEGGIASTTTPLGDVWGAGRLRMRMWEPEGMDAPYGFFWVKRVLADGNTTPVLVHPDATGVNQDIPADVDLFKAVAWWFEPNVNYSSGSAAELRTRVCNEDTSTCYVHDTTVPDAHRLMLDSTVAGAPWRIDVTGLSIPANLDPDDYYGQQKRAVYIAFYWEDRDRDDADGPDTGIQ